MLYKKWFHSVLVMVAIFVLSAIPGQTINNLGLGKESYHTDGHFIMYFLLGASYYYATGSKLKAVILALIFGVSDELHQLYVPMRAFQLTDIVVDTLGSMFGAIILWKLQPILLKRQKI